MKTDLKILVIGGGLGGLAAACVAASRGAKVTLCDKNDWLGGKAAVFEDKGFRFDMGPTILTVPSVLKTIFTESGRNISDYLDLRRLDPQWRCFFTDGSLLDLKEGVAEMTADLKSYAGNTTAEGYQKFIKLSKRLHEISNRFFFWKPVGGLRDTVNLKANMSPSTLSDVLALRMGQTVAGTIRSHIPDKRVAQMLDHFVQYVGSSPENAPAVLCSIGHMQTCEGIWYPIGGTRAVVEALVKLAQELGVTFRTGTDIQRIITKNGRVTGAVTAENEMLSADAIISNMDAVRTFSELLVDDKAAQKRARGDAGREPACSGVVFYWGLDRAYDHLLHHNFIFSNDPHEEFDWIYRKGEPAPDPTCYVAAPSHTEPSVAPAGGEALYVLVHTPYLRPHHDWKKMLPDYRRVIIQKLATTGGMKDLESRIKTEHFLTPQDIHERYKVLNGAIYGLASHGRFLGAFKPSNRTNISGLYLAGGAAHPGPGMPMVMMSGWIAADAMAHDMELMPSKARTA